MIEAARSGNGSWLTVWLLIFVPLLLETSTRGAQQMSVTSGIAEVNKTRLYYEVMGEGHPLVLIHGGGADRSMWDDQFKAFAEHYRVIRYDQRGSGKSEIPRERWSDSQDLYSLLRFLNVDKVYAIGLSQGGRIAADFTLEHPEMVDALILTSSNLDVQPEAYGKAKGTEIARKEGISRAIDVIMENPYVNSGKEYQAARQKMREMREDGAIFNILLRKVHQLFTAAEAPANPVGFSD